MIYHIEVLHDQIMKCLSLSFWVIVLVSQLPAWKIATFIQYVVKFFLMEIDTLPMCFTQGSTYLMICLSLPVTWMRRRSSVLEFKLRGQLNQCLDKKKAENSRYLRYLAPSCRAFSLNVLMKMSVSGVASNSLSFDVILLKRKKFPWVVPFITYYLASRYMKDHSKAVKAT